MGEKTSAPELSKEAGEVLEIARLIRLQAERAVALRTFAELGNTPRIIAALAQRIEGHTATLVRGAAFESIVLAVQRICDRGSGDKVSLSKAKSILANRSVLLEVSERGDREALNRFMEQTDRISAHQSQARLRRLRDLQVAHLIPSAYEGSVQPTYIDLWTVMDLALEAVHQLGLGTGTITMDFFGTQIVWQKRCRAYWRRLLREEPVDKKL